MNRTGYLPDRVYKRGSALRALGILDTPREPDFDDIVAHVARVCEVPTALISLLDIDRQFFKAAVGFDAPVPPLDVSICLHAVEEEAFLEIGDTSLDPRTRDNPLCVGEAAVRFYAGAVLRLDSGIAIGSLCILDTRPRRLTGWQRETMQILARQVVRQMQLRQALSAQDRLRGEIDHRIKNSLQMVASYLRLQRRNAGEEASEILRRAEQQVAGIVALHGALNEAGSLGRVNLAPYLERIAELMGGTLPHNIRVEADIAPAECSGDRAAAAGMIVNEFVANSVKHAFADDCEGVIRLQGRVDGRLYRLLLTDDGAGFDAGGAQGFGLKIIDAAARQLQADLSHPEAVRGSTLMVTFVADPA